MFGIGIVCNSNVISCSPIIFVYEDTYSTDMILLQTDISLHIASSVASRYSDNWYPGEDVLFCAQVIVYNLISKFRCENLESTDDWSLKTERHIRRNWFELCITTWQRTETFLFFSAIQVNPRMLHRLHTWRLELSHSVAVYLLLKLTLKNKLRSKFWGQNTQQSPQ